MVTAIHVKELPMPAGVSAVSNLEQVAVLVKYEVEEKLEEVDAEQSAGEPEIIQKGKTDEEEAKK